MKNGYEFSPFIVLRWDGGENKVGQIDKQKKRDCPLFL
jgi:hypothetical protein